MSSEGVVCVSEQEGKDRGWFSTPRGTMLALVALVGFFYGGSSLMWGYWGRAAAGLGAMGVALWIGSRLNERPGPPDAPESR